MRLTSKPLGILVLGLIFGGIAFSTWMGWWQTESDKVPVKFSSGEVAGEYNPADIRGSYTFGDISSLFDIPLEVLATAFDYGGENISEVRLNELEERFADLADAGMEIGTGSVRLFTAFYTGLPYETDEEWLLALAVQILKDTGELTEEQLAYLQNHVVPMAQVLGVGSEETDNSQTSQDASVESTPDHEPLSGNPQAGSGEYDESDRMVKGNTTFREVMDWGVSQEVIEGILGQSMPSPLVKVKDFCLEKGLEFGTVKTSLQIEVDAVTP